MRGQQERSGSLFSYVSIAERIPANHSLWRIRKLAYQALDRFNPTFCQLYASEGRPSVHAEPIAFGLTAAGILRDSAGVPTAGPAALQPDVPLVCAPQPRRSDLAPHHIHQEPGSVPERVCVGSVSAEAKESLDNADLASG
jgi:hypothetical protein